MLFFKILLERGIYCSNIALINKLMAADMVRSATSEKLLDIDWTKNIEICELVAKDHGQAKDAVKCIRKRLGHKNENTQLFTVRLLEMLMNNCGEHIHRQVIDNGLLPILVKLVKKKTSLPARERIFLLLDATQTSLGGAKGKFPQYYAAYYELVTSQVQFPQLNHTRFTQQSKAMELNENLKCLPIEASHQSIRCQSASKEPSSVGTLDHSIIDNATSMMEVLRETLNALVPGCPEDAADEFILDLVEQCSLQKQRIMHLAMTCHDEKVIAQAIELNEQLDKVLTLHDSLLSARAPTTKRLFANEESEDEEHLFRRICKGKALAEDGSELFRSSSRCISDDDFGRPLCIQQTDQDSRPRPPHHQVGSIPPPPAKHKERELFFKDKHLVGLGLAGNMRGLSIHSRTGSSSRSGSTDFSDTSGIQD